MSSAISSSRGSTRFGATVRGVLVSPGSAFVPALKRAETTSEGASTYVLSAMGGAAAMVLSLKIRALVGLRALTPDDFSWGLFVTSLVLAAFVAVGAQVVWSFVAPAAGGRDSGSPRSFRAVWALSACAQIPAVLLLAPLDVLFVGEGAFTTTDGGDSVALAWMALSTALSVSLAVWSVYVFTKGTAVATRATTGRTAGVVVLGVAAAALVVTALWGLLVGLGKVAG